MSFWRHGHSLRRVLDKTGSVCIFHNQKMHIYLIFIYLFLFLILLLVLLAILYAPYCIVLTILYVKMVNGPMILKLKIILHQALILVPIG